MTWNIVRATGVVARCWSARVEKESSEDWMGSPPRNSIWMGSWGLDKILVSGVEVEIGAQVWMLRKWTIVSSLEQRKHNTCWRWGCFKDYKAWCLITQETPWEMLAILWSHYRKQPAVSIPISHSGLSVFPLIIYILSFFSLVCPWPTLFILKC